MQLPPGFVGDSRIWINPVVIMGRLGEFLSVSPAALLFSRADWRGDKVTPVTFRVFRSML
jgi:hypothetical protein